MTEAIAATSHLEPEPVAMKNFHKSKPRSRGNFKLTTFSQFFKNHVSAHWQLWLSRDTSRHFTRETLY